MRKTIRRLWVLFPVLGSMVLATARAQEALARKELWYDSPAREWMQALPVGNGHLGAMVFGDPVHERLQLNEDSMWPGAADWGDSRGNPRQLQEVRDLLKAGRNKEADSLIVEHFSYKSVLRSHQTMGDLYIDFNGLGNISDYKRSLDLENATATVQFKAGGYEVQREIFASYPDDVLVIRLQTTNPEGMDFMLRLDRPEDQGRRTVRLQYPSASEIRMKGMVTQYGGRKLSQAFPLDYGVQFDTRLKVRTTSGTLSSSEGGLRVSGAREATLLIISNTSFYHGDAYEAAGDKALEHLESRSFMQLQKAHIEDYTSLYGRMSFDLGGTLMDTLPTNRRLERIREGEDDPALAATLFQYGRYLLIASSRPGSNPANLQGLWNEHIEAPWNADYHLNINLQMNYWPAEVTQLGELHGPYFDFIDKVLERGKSTAKDQYGMSGSVLHHATDLWAPAWMRAERAYWGSWIHGGGWAVQHYWEHYRFTRDLDFLRNRAYPAMRAVAAFYMDWLVWDEALGLWVSSPETSPENSYFTESGHAAAVSYGSAMGHQIIAEVFDNLLLAADILDYSDPFLSAVGAKREKLHPGVLVGSDGRILEWNKPYREPEPGHRHISHLYALHPGTGITAAHAEKFEAARKTIDYRLEHGGAGTGWSRAWMINMTARLLDSVALQEHIRKLLAVSIAPNLFDEHPPFQIDGNFGYTAGVAEALLQSHEGFLRLLPALPGTWKTGRITGLKARGNIKVDLYWKDGQLEKVGLLANASGECSLRYGEVSARIPLTGKKKIWLDKTLQPL